MHTCFHTYTEGKKGKELCEEITCEVTAGVVGPPPMVVSHPRFRKDSATPRY